MSRWLLALLLFAAAGLLPSTWAAEVGGPACGLGHGSPARMHLGTAPTAWPCASGPNERAHQGTEADGLNLYHGYMGPNGTDPEGTEVVTAAFLAYLGVNAVTAAVETGIESGVDLLTGNDNELSFGTRFGINYGLNLATGGIGGGARTAGKVLAAFGARQAIQVGGMSAVDVYGRGNQWGDALRTNAFGSVAGEVGGRALWGLGRSIKTGNWKMWQDLGRVMTPDTTFGVVPRGLRGSGGQGIATEISGAASGGRGLGGHQVVDRVAGEIEGALLQADRHLRVGSSGKTAWGRVYRRYAGTGHWMEPISRGMALQTIANQILQKNPYLRDAGVIMDMGSRLRRRNAAGNLLRPDFQIPLSGGRWGILDITTAGQSAKIDKYRETATPWLVNILYR